MLEILMNRRSIRKFKNQAVEREKLDKIIKGALTSPSGRSIQPWELIVVDDKEILERLGASRGGASKPLAKAAISIVVIADYEVTDTWIEDASIISTNIQLMAQSLGLGSCWIQVRERFTLDHQSVDNYIKNLLHIPKNFNVLSMIAIGYPDEDKEQHDLEKLKYNKIHYNKY